MKKRYRSKVRIYVDILESVQRSGMAPPTRIMQAANLSYDRLTAYLERLVLNGLLERKGDVDVVYALTGKGYEFLKEFKRFKNFAEAFGITV